MRMFEMRSEEFSICCSSTLFCTVSVLLNIDSLYEVSALLMKWIVLAVMLVFLSLVAKPDVKKSISQELTFYYLLCNLFLHPKAWFIKRTLKSNHYPNLCDCVWRF